MARPAPLAAAVVLAAALGCGGIDGDPRTVPVTGQVLLPSRQPLAGGVIQLQPLAEPTLTTAGEIGKDGTFTLSTVAGSRKVAGAVAGKHRVTVIPAQGGDQKARPVVLAQPVEIGPGGESQLVITLPRDR